MKSKIEKARPTTAVPVTTMEEVPVLSAHEREELLTALDDASADIREGRGLDHDPEQFKDRLTRAYRAAKR